MAVKYERTVAYICPKCTGITETAINIFQFSGSRSVRLICDDMHCGETGASIRLHDSKYVISTVCPVCAETHQFSISKSAFWNKKLISFSCPETVDVDIIFIGEKEAVINAVNESEFDSDDDMADEMLLSNFIDHINDMLYDGSIHCKCGSHRILPTLTNDELILTCDKCNSQLSIRITPENIFKILTSTDLCIK